MRNGRMFHRVCFGRCLLKASRVFFASLSLSLGRDRDGNVCINALMH